MEQEGGKGGKKEEEEEEEEGGTSAILFPLSVRILDGCYEIGGYYSAGLRPSRETGGVGDFRR